MGLFNSNSREDYVRLQAEQMGLLDKYSKRLAQYSKGSKESEEQLAKLQDMAGSYEQQLSKVQEIIEEYENREHNIQMDSVQTAMDLKYIKEQGDQLQEQVHVMSEGQIKLMRKQMEINGANLEELVVQHKESNVILHEMSRKMASGRRMLGLLAAMAFLSLGCIIFLILYVLEIIVI